VFHQLEKRIAESVAAHLQTRYGVETEVVAELPKEPSFGDLSIVSAFALARQLRKAPRVIASEILQEMPPVEGVAKVEMAGNGYLNFRFDRSAYGFALVCGREDAGWGKGGGKVIVEHTNINPNKAAHIGHLRNAVLGDTFVRMLRSVGRQVEVQNYIDNTGVQVADVVAGFQHLEHLTPRQVAALAADPKVRFDHLCWDLYARTSAHYQGDPESLRWRRDTLHAIEAGEGEASEMAHVVADAIVNCHVRTMQRLGIEYDVLPRESEILHLRFWATAFELLKERKGIYFETQGKNAGCWVMPGTAFSDASGEDADKVIVRSNGTVTYVGKDIAYQLWKFGLLGKDFRYREWMRYPDGRVLWVSTDQPSDAAAPPFGGGEWVYNVIDSRQSYLQDVVAAGLRALGYDEQAGRSVHFSYEMVALTPRTCAELGIDIPVEDRDRSYVEVSGRKGLGVKADDLMDKLVERATEEVDARHPEAPAGQRRQVGEQIAAGALRYFMLKYTRNAVIAFDLQEALSFEGETGPYVQYAAVRARNILRKLEERGDRLPIFDHELDAAAMGRQLESEELWQMALFVSKTGSVIERAIVGGEPAHVAKHAFQLAQGFNSFYHSYPVLQEPDPQRRIFLLWLTEYFRQQLERTLGILGITVPPYM
jgi:arginyl-tRNA synthetase